jgi:2'-5' RNA ligase
MAVVRSFLAVEMSNAIARQLDRAIQRLARQDAWLDSDVRWVQAGQMHLTLCFLGDVDWNQTHQVARIARRVLSTCPPITISCQGLGAFPNLERPRVLWAGVQEWSEAGDADEADEADAAESSDEAEAAEQADATGESDAGEPSETRMVRGLACPQLAAISEALVQAYLNERFFPDTKPWNPHVTLGRLPGGRKERMVSAAESFAELTDVEFGIQTVREVKLLSSERGPLGPIYRPVATVPLGG